jgi:hypothetical protein
VGVDGALAEGHVGDDLVHLHRVRRGATAAAAVLLTDLLRGIDPLFGQELVRHRGLLVSGFSAEIWAG